MQTPTLGQYLLPNLRSIHWALRSWDLVPFLRLFLNPGLIDVDIQFPDHNLHIYRPATISLIPTGDLTHLQFGSEGNDDLSMNALHDLLDKASETLKSVGLDEKPSMAVIDKLIQLPNLRHLDVQLPETRISPPSIVFPSLEVLHVFYREASSWHHILRNIPNPALRELGVSFRGSSSAYFQTLGSSLFEANIERTLSSLQCSCDESPLTETGLRSFLSFERLTRLELLPSCTKERCCSELNDRIISKLAAALPQLTYLALGGSPCEIPTSDVTITSLVALSHNCVNLNLLQLHFNAEGIASRGTYVNSQAHKFTCKLRTLSVGSQPLPSNRDDIIFVTFAILHVFPHLETISHARGDWDQVRRDVELFRKASRIFPPPTTD